MKPSFFPLSCVFFALSWPMAARSQTLTVQDGLQLWLKADAGVTADGEGTVTDWNDQTANANNATQFDPAKGPKLVANGVNSKPVIRFDGTDDYLEIPDSESLSIAGDLTTFFVIRFTDFATFRAVWAKTANNFPGPVDYYTVPGTGVPRIYRGNGTENNLGAADAAQGLRAGAFITAGFELEGTLATHYLAAQSIGGANITAEVMDADTPLIIGSRGDLFTKMKGDIAEIVIYNRALTEAERTSVTDYLGQKYNIQNIPPTASLTVTPAGPALAVGDTVTLTATPADPDGTVTKVDFFANGAPLATAAAPPYSVKVTLDSTGSYSFTARATDDRDGTATSAAVVRTVSGGGDAVLDVQADLSLWVKADAGVTTGPGGVVTGWADQSPNHNDAAPADETTAPLLVAGAGPNGKPVLRFDGMDDALTVPDSDSISFDGDVTSFFVVKMDDFATFRAVWAKTASNLPASVDYYLMPSSGVPRFFRGAGTGAAGNLRSIDGAPLRAGAFELAGFSSAGDTMSQYLSGQLNGSSAGVVAKADLDNPLFIGTREDNVTRLKGDLAEILIYKSALSAENLRKAQLYLARKYAVPLTTTLNTAPTLALTAPAAGASFAIPAEVALTATAADADGSIVKVEFLVNGTVAATDTTAPYQASVSFPVAGSPLLSVRTTDNLGAVVTSAPITITLTSEVASVLPDLANLRLWLKADTGVTQTAGAVSAWNDQSGNLNNAVQTVASQQPVLVANELNGKPVLRFDGTDDFLSAASSPTLAGTGDISSFFVVRFDDFDTFRMVWSKSDVNYPAPTDHYIGQGTGLPTLFRGSPTSFQSVPSSTPLTAGEFAVVGFDTAGTDVHHFLNGGLSGGGTIVATMRDTGKPLLVGQRDDGVTRMKGDIAEIVIYSSTLSDADRAQVVSYLGTKYNIPVENTILAFPPLSISAAGGNITVTWPVDAVGFTLEASDTMEEGTWVEVPGVTGNTVTQPRGTRNFYRLRRAPAGGQ